MGAVTMSARPPRPGAAADAAAVSADHHAAAGSPLVFQHDPDADNVRVTERGVRFWLVDLELPSTNNLYRNVRGRGGRALTSEAKVLKAAIIDRLWVLARGVPLPTSDRLELTIALHLPRAAILTKAGRAKKYDASNRVKLVEDALVAAVARILPGYDDARHWRVTVSKLVAERSGVRVTLGPLRELSR